MSRSSIHVQPSSKYFQKYIVQLTNWLEHEKGVRPCRTHSICAFLTVLEQNRRNFKRTGKAAFQSGGLTNMQFANALGYTTTSEIEKIRAQAEKNELIEVKRRMIDYCLNDKNLYLLSNFKKLFLEAYPEIEKSIGGAIQYDHSPISNFIQ